jgi:hypothetical protein
MIPDLRLPQSESDQSAWPAAACVDCIPSTSDGTEPEVTYIKRARTFIADYKAAKKQMYERGA